MAALQQTEKSRILEVIKAALAPAASNLSALLGKSVTLSPREVREMSWADLGKDTARYVTVRVQLEGDLEGFQNLLIAERDAAIMGDLMIGGGGTTPPDSLNDLYLSAVTEIVGQMMDSMFTAMASSTGNKITSSTPEIKVAALNEEAAMISRYLGGDTAICVLCPFVVEGLIDSQVQVLFGVQMSKEMSVFNAQSAPAVNTEPSTVQVGVAAPRESTVPVVQPVQFAPLMDKGSAGRMPNNLDLLMDVSLQVTVELGRAQKYVKEILALGSGSVIQLDKLAGEPVDVFVNDKLIAKGEVVVINENFGVRITEILSPKDRIPIIP